MIDTCNHHRKGKRCCYKRPNISWTSCATRTLNLMLERISKFRSFKGVNKKAKLFAIFFYAHHKTLALMKKFTKREIVWPRVTSLLHLS